MSREPPKPAALRHHFCHFHPSFPPGFYVLLRSRPGSLLFLCLRLRVLTHLIEAADVALRASRHTHRAAVIDEPVAEIIALLRRNDLPKLPLHLGRLLDIIDEADQVAQAVAEAVAAAAIKDGVARICSEQ